MFPDWQPAMVITAERLSAMQWSVVRQAVDQTVTSSIVPQNTNIIIPVVATGIYRYHLFVNYRADAAADIRTTWVTPTGATMQRFHAGAGPAATGGPTNFTTTHWRRLVNTDYTAGGAGVSNNLASYEFGEIFVGGTGGNCIFQFAQNVSDVIGTILGEATFVDYIRIG